MNCDVTDAPSASPDSTISNHARLRMAQRGIAPDAVLCVLRYGDIEAPAGSGCHELRLSRRSAEGLRLEGLVGICCAERAARTALIVSADGAVVTAYPKAAAAPVRKSKRRAKTRIHSARSARR